MRAAFQPHIARWAAPLQVAIVVTLCGLVGCATKPSVDHPTAPMETDQGPPPAPTPSDGPIDSAAPAVAPTVPPLKASASEPNPPAAPPGLALRPLSSLPGWSAEDHLAALKAFRAGCGAARAPAWREVCAAARSDPADDEAAARAFFERRFQAEAPSAPGVLTAYYAPVFPAQAAPDEVFSAPVRPPPPEATDDPAYDLPRSAIEQQPATDALAFMKPEDLFYLQIQGSGALVFPDGHRMKAVYAGDNRRPFTPIAGLMAKAGLIPRERMSGTAIREWLADHRGPAADRVMDQNARYIFFTLAPDDGGEPNGAAGTPLTAGRALAVDPAFHAYGALYWIDADAPLLRGAAPVYRRLALALDTGSAIRGERRADLYLGRGDDAGAEAGRVRHSLELVRLIPISPGAPAPASSTDRETPPTDQAGRG